MIYKFLLLQFIAHLLGDFIFQPHRWAIRKKRQAITLYHLWHVLIIFVLSYSLSFDYGFFWPAILLTLVHFATDVLKSYFQLNFERKESFWFFADQIAHLTSIILISCLYNHYFGIDFIYKIPLKHVAIAAGFIFCAKPANIFIKHIFSALEIAVPEITTSQEVNKDLPNAGKLIGVTERFVVLALILANQYSVVGLLIAAKSILRFKDNKKNEYVLVGTMLSFGIAILTGILITQISSK